MDKIVKFLTFIFAIFGDIVYSIVSGPLQWWKTYQKQRKEKKEIEQNITKQITELEQAVEELYDLLSDDEKLISLDRFRKTKQKIRNLSNFLEKKREHCSKKLQEKLVAVIHKSKLILTTVTSSCQQDR